MQNVIRGLALLLVLALAPVAGRAQASFTNPDGSRSPASVAEIKTGAGTSDAVSTSNPMPTASAGTVAVAYSGPTSASVGTSSGTLITAAAYTRAVQICTLPTSTSNVWLRLDGGTAAPNVGVPVWGGGGCTSIGTPALPMPTGNITAITDGGSSQTVTLAGG
jgi:hypothetical protein